MVLLREKKVLGYKRKTSEERKIIHPINDPTMKVMNKMNKIKRKPLHFVVISSLENIGGKKNHSSYKY